MHSQSLTLLLGVTLIANINAGIANEATVAPPADAVFHLPHYTVTLSQPVLVGRRQGYLWFPSMARLANGDLIATMTDYADINTNTATGLNAFSGDDGRTWSALVPAPYGEANLRLPSGEQLFLPYYLFPRPGGMGAPYNVIAKGSRSIKVVPEGLLVAGWPRPDRKIDPKLDVTGFVFNGQTVKTRDDLYLATLYGCFDDDKRYNLVLAESADGVKWRIRTVIADEKCKLTGTEGPCESAICRLADGRLMCIFRLAGHVPYGQTWSSDEGRTWSEPIAMDAFSVQPSVAVMKNGTVVLSGGRPGLYLWLNADGTGKQWERVDVMAHHNASCPADQIVAPGNTSSYTEVLALDETHLLMIYDRLANGWNAVGTDQTNSVWVVRVTLSPPGGKG